MRSKLVALVGVLLLLSVNECATPSPSPSSGTRSVSSASKAPPPTGIAVSSTGASPTPTLAPVLWNAAGVRTFTDAPPPAPSTPAPTNVPGCDGAEFLLLPTSARTAPTTSQGGLTTFVLQFTGTTSCSINPAFFGITMTAADGTTVPIDSTPAGPAHLSIVIRPHQLVFGSISWTVNQGSPHPTQLTFNLGDTPSSTPPISISVTDVTVPPPPHTPSPQSSGQSTAYGMLTSAADPATLSTLTGAVTSPAAVRTSATMLYTVTLTNFTNTTVPLTGCPQFVEQLTVVPLKASTTTGARGPLNCAHLPKALTAGSSVTMQMQLNTAGQVLGPGWLTWQLRERGHAATAVTAPVLVH